MHVPISRLFIPVLAASLAAQAPDVQERRFPNGFQVLLVDKPGTRALHASLVVRAGRADTGALPSAAAELLAASLFRRCAPGDVNPDPSLEALLKQEEGARESLRLERSRRARLRLAEPSPEELGLVQLLEAHLTELRAREKAAGASDLLDGLGAVRRGFEVGADEIAVRLELPPASFAPWCRLQQQQLQRLVLSRLPHEREAWEQRLAREAGSEAEGLSLLLATAFSGHPYAQALEARPGALDWVGWSELRACARTMLSPDRMALVLVGDLRAERAWPIVEATFGALNSEGAGHRRTAVPDLAPPKGTRRLQVGTRGEPRLFMAWHLPASSHPDEGALRVLAHLLGGGKSSRLVRRLQEERGVAARLSVRTGVPGGRDPSLLLVEAVPAEGKGLAELEEALRSEFLRIQSDRFPEEEIRQAQRQVEAEQGRVQEDAASLARALGTAVAQTGDWRQAFRARSAGPALTPESIQALVWRYLVPSQGITALLEPDPLLVPRDAMEERLGKILGTLVRRKVEDPAQAERVVQETLRQLRMLSAGEREQTLKLLEAQGGA